MVNLIPRFYDAEKGHVRVDGEDVKAVDLKKLHEAVAFVPQKANLFTGTVRDNMKYGNDEATDDQIWHALEIAKLKISSRPIQKAWTIKLNKAAVISLAGNVNG